MVRRLDPCRRASPSVAAFMNMDMNHMSAHPSGGTPMTSPALAERLDGLLFFPVTAFGPDGGLDLDAFRAHVRAGVEAGAAAVFACCGTGEFHALTPEEFRACVAAAVEETAGTGPGRRRRRLRHRARPAVRRHRRGGRRRRPARDAALPGRRRPGGPAAALHRARRGHRPRRHRLPARQRRLHPRDRRRAGPGPQHHRPQGRPAATST